VALDAVGTIHFDQRRAARIERVAYPNVLAENTTGSPCGFFVGTPDDTTARTGLARVTYDFERSTSIAVGGQTAPLDVLVADGPGPDFSVYAASLAAFPPEAIEVHVSLDGRNFARVQPSADTAPALPGDELKPGPDFARAYDLRGSGVPLVRYLSIEGTAAPGVSLDAVGAIHFEEGRYVPPQAAAYPNFLAENDTGVAAGIFVGTPDDTAAFTRFERVTYDFEDAYVVRPVGATPATDVRITDGPGGDFTLYAGGHAAFDPAVVDVLVSEDGSAFVNVSASAGPTPVLPGDELMAGPEFARSYDLEGSGLSSVRYVRVRGLSATGVLLDAVGAIHFEEVVTPPRATFRRGDANSSGQVDLSDAVFVLNFLFLGGSDPACLDAADADDNGSLELTDPVRILNVLFLGGTPIPAPGMTVCGPDGTEDGLGCERSSCS
jgi:hypothetical protein